MSYPQTIEGHICLTRIPMHLPNSFLLEGKLSEGSTGRRQSDLVCNKVAFESQRHQLRLGVGNPATGLGTYYEKEWSIEIHRRDIERLHALA